MGQGVGRVWRPPAPRVDERALPFSDEFWCFGPDKGPSIVFGQATRAAGAAAARVFEGVFCGARHAPPPPISRMRAHCRVKRDNLVSRILSRMLNNDVFII